MSAIDLAPPELLITRQQLGDIVERLPQVLSLLIGRPVRIAAEAPAPVPWNDLDLTQGGGDFSHTTQPERRLFTRLAALGEGGAFVPLGEENLQAAEALVARGWAARDDDDVEALRLSTIGRAEAERQGL